MRIQDLWNLFKIRKGAVYIPERETLSPREQLWKDMIQVGCVECRRKPIKFFEGPTGGMCVNIFCGHCGQGYNITPVAGWAEKIHKDEKYIERDADDNLQST